MHVDTLVDRVYFELLVQFNWYGFLVVQTAVTAHEDFRVYNNTCCKILLQFEFADAVLSFSGVTFVLFSFFFVFLFALKPWPFVQ